ncbi:MAG: hypothetical protein K9K38_13285 [Rhodoferax sp.]|nr:hypothetical protein [Rhodoferax sp.]
MKTLLRLSVIALSVGVAVSLAACSGSSVSEPTPTPTPTPTPALSTSALQGIWRSPAGSASTVSAVVLPDGKVWALMSNASSTRVLKGAFEVQGTNFAGTAKSFTLGTSTTTTTQLTASVVQKTSLAGTVVSAGLSEPIGLAYQTRYDTAATLADFAGAWTATLGPGTVRWTLSATGAITGTRTTGCTYSGQLSVRPEQKAVVMAAVTETCAGATTQLSGVAAKTEDKLGITMLLTNGDESAAVAISLVQGG